MYLKSSVQYLHESCNPLLGRHVSERYIYLAFHNTGDKGTPALKESTKQG
jgi:hypothetical protein